MSPLPRELVRWIQTLDLPIAIRLPKRDLSNGYLFAEMCARYWQGVELHGFENKLSKHNKEANWKLLRKYFSKNRFEVDDALIQSVIACDDGAAEQLLFRLYTALTKREIQLFAPLNDAEVDHVPVFVKQASVVKKDHASSTAAQAPSDEAQQKQAAEDRQRLEAQQKRLEAQQRQQGSKPKTLSKTQGIQSADKDEEDGHVHHLVQFSSVTVKPLPPQLLSRFGVSKPGGEGSGGSGSGGGGAGGGGGGGAGAGSDGAVGLISKQLAEALDAMDIAPWPTSAALPTLAEYFYKHLPSLENSLRSALWSRLMAQSEEVAAVICKRPSEMAALAEISSTHLRQCALAGESVGVGATAGGAQASEAADPASSSSSAAATYAVSGVVKRYYETVTALVSSTNPNAALYGLSQGLLPILRSMNPLSAAAADALGDVVLAHIRLGASGGTSTPLASAFFSALYDGIGTSSRTDFLLLLHAVLKGFVVAPKRTAVAVPPPHPDLDDAGSVGIHSGGAAAAPLRGRIDDATSSVSYYNAVAGLYAESPSERLASLRLLTRLVELGAAGQVLRQHHLGELVEGVWNGTAAITQTNEGMVLFSKFIVELIGATSAAATAAQGDEGDFQPQLQRAVVELNQFALDPAHHLSRAARQVLLFHLSQSLHIFPLADARGTSTSVALVRHLMSTTDLGSADSNPLLSATPVVVFCGRVCGAIRVHSVLTQVCPLRCVNAILALTAAEIAAASSAPGGGGTTTPKNAAAATASDRRGSSTTLSKSAARILRTGDTAELGLARLRWVQALFSSQEAGTLSARTQGSSISDDDLVTAWWSVVKALEPTLSLALFTAELLHGQITAASSNAKIAAQLPAEAVCQQIFFIASLAQNVLARLYIDFSGSVDPLPRSREGYDDLRCDAQLASKAAEWFNQVVVGS